MKTIDLSGVWKLSMDEERKGVIPAFSDTITLPDTTSHARKGKKNDWRATGYLTDTYYFEGHAWFERTFTVTEKMREQDITLFLERTRKTIVYIDGKTIGACDSLCTPHRYPIPKLSAGVHRITICVDNTDYPTKGGHLTSPDTQTNWNGITGRIELQVRPKSRIDDVMIISDVGKNGITVKFTATDGGVVSAYVEGYEKQEFSVRQGENSFFYSPSEKMPLWSEYNPQVLTLVTEFGGEEQRHTFGMRKIWTDGLKIYVNGNETFMRGKHDGLVFPLTGYAPTTVSEWRRVLEIAKNYGINHYRFHTCCPPEAAFIAADELGIYMQPELPFWGTVPDEITEEQQFLIDEGFRMLKEFGNHPSFAMMSLGNELWGSKEVMDKILKDYRAVDSRHLYTDGSNNFQFWPAVLENSDFLSGVRLSKERLYRGSYAMCDAPLGHIQTDAPNSVHNYDTIIKPEKIETEGGTGGKILIQYGTGVKEVEADGGEGLIPDVPVISHEIGQYETYPDYREISHYTGSIKAENIALYREKAEKKGLLPYADKFFYASGKLAVACYKAELETALKSENLSGFQLLDLQDFPGQGTALVGVLNSLMEPKDTVTAEEWKCFCNDTVVMAEFAKFVFSSDEKISFGITVFNTNPVFRKGKIRYSLTCEGKTVASGEQDFTISAKVTKLGETSVSVPRNLKPQKYTLNLVIDSTEIHNSYDFMVYPKIDVLIDEKGITCGNKKIAFVNTPEEAEKLMKNGEKVILVPSAEGKLEGTYCTDFWCYPMFSSISESMGRPLPVGTMGCLIQEQHPIFESFPTEFYSTPQWFEPIMHSHCENLDGTDIVPLVWMIDNPHRAERYGIIYEQETDSGKILSLTVRLWEIADKSEARWLARSIAEYLYK